MWGLWSSQVSSEQQPLAVTITPMKARQRRTGRSAANRTFSRIAVAIVSSCIAVCGFQSSPSRSRKIWNGAESPADPKSCNINATGTGLPSSTSLRRRNFIQFSSAIGAVLGLSHPAFAEQTFASASRKDLVAVPGPSAPFSTTRSYRNIVLSNGLKVVLVRDTMAQQSSAAITIEGAGLLSDPVEIPGLAHLMEHIVLSSDNRRRTPMFVGRRKILGDVRLDRDKGEDDEENFEDWICAQDGDSNAFTAPGFVCFHLSCPHETLPEALERFSRLFTLDEIENTVCKPGVINREIGRVSSEIDRVGDQSRAFYFLKSQVDGDHPFSRLFAGSRSTLQTTPTENGLDVATHLTCFFRDHYLASRATLVVVSNEGLGALDRWISPYSNIMSQRERIGPPSISSFPPKVFKDRTDLTQSIILRSREDGQFDENHQTLSLEWPLSLVYERNPTENVVSASAVGFILTQILSRRGPGSLRQMLEKLGWAPKGNRGVPRFSFPIDQSGFQILRMEIGLSLDGFANRSAVIAAVFESIRTVLSRPLPTALIEQYLCAALLHGYLLAPRPPDCITLAVDSIRYGLSSKYGVGGTSGVGLQSNQQSITNWYLMPSPDDKVGVENMKRIVTETLTIMADERGPLVSIRASAKAIFGYSKGLVDKAVLTGPLLPPWTREAVTGARVYTEKRAAAAGGLFRSLAFVTAKVDGEAALTPPYLNPLLPTSLRPPRPVVERSRGWAGESVLYLDSALAGEDDASLKLVDSYAGSNWREMSRALAPVDGSGWKLLQVPPSKTGTLGIALPVRPPEPGVEGAVVLQLLSSLPSTFTSRQLTLANLWLLSYDDAIVDIAESGALAGCAYEWSFNRAGLRLCFRGLSQSLPSYVRRLCRRLVAQHANLLSGKAEVAESAYQRAMNEVTRSPKIGPLQKKQMVDVLTRGVSNEDVADQALTFLKATNGAYVISQGDLTPSESLQLSSDLRQVFRGYGDAKGFECEPALRDILYRPFWKPRESSPCLLPGLSLLADTCGRVPR